MSETEISAYVSLYCDEESHRSAPWLVTTFVNAWMAEVGAEGNWVWTRSLYYWRHGEPSIRLAGTPIARLAGDAYIDGGALRVNPQILEKGDSRTRWNLRCKRCGLGRPLRGAQLDPVLDQVTGVLGNQLELRLTEFLARF